MCILTYLFVFSLNYGYTYIIIRPGVRKMKSKANTRIKALELRSEGLSYSEIKKLISVPKSTLSGWLKDISLNEEARKIINFKIAKARKIGAEARRRQRLEKVLSIRKSAFSQIKKIGKSGLFLMGIMLYWAEGSKIRERNISQQVAFDNSDPRMCRFFLKWLKQSLKISDNEISFSIYINSTFKGRELEILNFWSKEINLSSERFSKISFTQARFSKIKRRVNRFNYFGLLRIKVRKSVDLNRRIDAWIERICDLSGDRTHDFRDESPTS